jgi:Domain of unknown function (DUF4874)/Domain of unknown function (DUF4832)/Putative Ig domain
MKFLSALTLIALIVFAGTWPALGESRTYVADEGEFGNPERGWFVFYELKPTYHNNSNNWATSQLLAGYFAQGYRLAKHVTLLPTRTDALPQSFLNQLTAEAAVFRAAGMKVIYRFTYNWNHNLNDQDASQAVTEGHLDQLASFFAANADVIFGHEMGFIGFWGEMHHSTSGHIIPNTAGFTASGKALVQKYLSVVPITRSVSLRYPQAIFRDPASYGSLGYMNLLTSATAYTGSAQSRLGSWYANFGDGDILWNENAEYAQEWIPSTEFVGMWSHCDHFGGVTMDAQRWLANGQACHYQALSNPKDESATFDIYQAWINTGTYSQYAKKLGYRYRLASASVPDTVNAGGVLGLQVSLANDGWARPLNPRTIEVVLRAVSNGVTTRLPFSPAQDTRLWLPGPGQTSALQLNVMLSGTLAAGSYRVLLNLPDPYANLAARPEYSIRLANLNTWEAGTGYNDLGLTTLVSPGIPVVQGEQSITAPLGASLSYQIVATPAPTSYTLASGTLPSGLTLESGTGIIRGTPTASGVFSPTFTASNGSGTSPAVPITITIQTTLAAFRTIHGLAANGSQDANTPASDTISNLLKYAFNLIGSGLAQAPSLATPYSTILAPGGSAGLPLVDREPTSNRLRLTYIRRKASSSSGIDYLVEFTSTLAAGSWAANPSATEDLTSIDATFERVILTDSIANPGKRFVRLRVVVVP